VSWNDFGQPIGYNATMFANFIGAFVVHTFLSPVIVGAVQTNQWSP